MAVKQDDGDKSKSAGSGIVQKGDVPVSGHPKKIAITDFRFADSLLALGIKPYAMASYLGSTKLEWLDDKALNGVVNLGEQGNPEAVVDANPDLIIAWENQIDQYDNYSKIAPTLVIGESPDWKADFRQFAKILGKEKEAKQFLAQYDDKAKTARQRLAPKIGSDTTAVSMRIVGKEFRIYGDDQKLGRILYHDLKFKAPDKVKAIQRREAISMEALPQFDADYLFVEVGAPNIGGDKEAEQKFDELEQSPIWKNLKAVKNKHVILVPYWTDLDFPQVNVQSMNMVVKKVTSM
ncbi:hypothetical protein GCM10011391_39220 [Pullulanibacillus camelliae]|uniref:Fe/B12 periplasmic-binding domain-containing protein n=1 Tax=Pullulanibacillus camelliae TaxID=1707096 RepID=A0A8J2YNM3_9BACL|nr:hypothetical protein GCM10011391_39220 [Pullulanibacillus camelliae]